MRLISLTANAESFHPVFFRPSGPSFIVGKQKKSAVVKSPVNVAIDATNGAPDEMTTVAPNIPAADAPNETKVPEAPKADTPSGATTGASEGVTDTHTYNGVGKSLLLYLINYCLGAEPKESFTTQIEQLGVHLARINRGP